MTESELKKLAQTIGNCASLETKQKLYLANDIVGEFLLLGKRKREFLKLVEQYSGLTKIIKMNQTNKPKPESES